MCSLIIICPVWWMFCLLHMKMSDSVEQNDWWFVSEQNVLCSRYNVRLYDYQVCGKFWIVELNCDVCNDTYSSLSMSLWLLWLRFKRLLWPLISSLRYSNVIAHFITTIKVLEQTNISLVLWTITVLNVKTNDDQ